MLPTVPYIAHPNISKKLQFVQKASTITIALLGVGFCSAMKKAKR
jgi:hypothetical protein